MRRFRPGFSRVSARASRTVAVTLVAFFVVLAVPEGLLQDGSPGAGGPEVGGPLRAGRLGTVGARSPEVRAAGHPVNLVEGIRFCDLLGELGVDCPPRVDAPSIYLVEAETGDVLYAQGETLRLPMASTTKIMTAILACESGRLGEVAVASREAAYVDGSKIFLREGEPQTLLDLTYAAILESANDACIAIAEFFDGSVAGFADRMNAKARELGLRDTRFSNPHGLPAENHYTTARDLATLARYAMKNPIFREIASTKSRDIPLIDPRSGGGERGGGRGGDLERSTSAAFPAGVREEDDGEPAGARQDAGEGVRHLWNHNKLLFRRDDCTGIKPGYTTEAGHCAVVSARRGDTELVVAVLGSRVQGYWEQLDRLLDWGFESFQKRALAVKGQALGRFGAKDGRRADAVARDDLQRMVPSGVGDGDPRLRIASRVEVPEVLSGVAKGDMVGRATFYLVGEGSGREFPLGSVVLVAGDDVPKMASDSSIIRWALGGSWSIRKALAFAAVMGVVVAVAYRSAKLEMGASARRRRRRRRRL